MSVELSALTQISNLLVTLNSSVNFIIYCIYGDKFKKIFCLIFCKRCGGGGGLEGPMRGHYNGRNARLTMSRGRTMTASTGLSGISKSRAPTPLRLSSGAVGGGGGTPFSGAATPNTCTNTAPGSPADACPEGTGHCSNTLSILSATNQV